MSEYSVNKRDTEKRICCIETDLRNPLTDMRQYLISFCLSAGLCSVDKMIDGLRDDVGDDCTDCTSDLGKGQ